MKTFLHVTDLDSIVWYNKIEAMTVDEMKGRLLRTEPPNERMKAGTAFHAILEDPPDIIEQIENDGFTFTIDCDAEIVLPQIREIRAEKTYKVDDVEVTLSGGCDGITARIIKDHKLTFRPNPETYFDSYQWRAYLDIFSADIFEYLIYAGIMKGKEITIRDIFSLKMYRYPGMTADLRGGIRTLLDFVKTHVPELLNKERM